MGVRILRFFRPLRVLVTSILGIMKSAVWAMLLLAMFIYFFGIIFTQGAGQAMQSGEGDFQNLHRYYGSLGTTLYYLFTCISGGEDWAQVALPLAEVHWIYRSLFLMYISFVVFALLNVMTGVFCQSAIESAEKDQDMVIQELLRSKEETVKRLENLFAGELDKKGNGELTVQQFETLLENEQLKAWFCSVDIDITDGWTLFKLLDTEGQGCIKVNSFVEGCLRLRGHAKKIDVMEMMHEHKRILTTVMQMVATVKELNSAVQGSVSVHPSIRQCAYDGGARDGF